LEGNFCVSVVLGTRSVDVTCMIFGYTQFETHGNVKNYRITYRLQQNAKFRSLSHLLTHTHTHSFYTEDY